jgi:hypothetical protein
LSLPFSADHEIVPIRGYLDRTVQVGAIDGRAMAFEALDRRWRWVAVIVVCTNADHRDLGPQHIEQLVRGGRRRTVVGNFEHIDRTTQMTGQPARNELRIDVLFHVAGEQHPTRAETQVDHDRLVVDLFAVVTCFGRHRSPRRPVDVEFDSVQPQAVASCRDRRLTVLFGKDASVGRIAGTATDHP